MDEKLPEKVDVIVMGTGLPEAILASACARSGLSVLHLDRNGYYGADWSSFTMTTIDEFLETSTKILDPLPDSVNLLLEKSEKIVELGNRNIAKDIHYEWINGDENEVKLRNVFRRFSIDVLPKVLLSRGSMVQTLCDSQVSQYAEFKLVDRQLCPLIKEDGEIEMSRVPCSKGEIFTSSVLSMMEKRGLMKFITFCTQWKSKTEEEGEDLLGEYSEKSFESFLGSMGIGTTLQSFIVNTIGILQPNPTALNGMKASCQFMDSVGHFGPSPFLFPLYGCGELAQCFCRLAAVFGSLYCLGRPVQALIYNDERIVGVIADNQRINCDHVIMAGRYVPEEYPSCEVVDVERLTYVTEKSLMQEEKEHISLINIAPLRPKSDVSRIIEAGYEACTAPKGYYLLHATGSKNSREGLECVVENLLEKNEIQPLWKLKFEISSSKFDVASLPSNLIVSPTIDASVDYSELIENCRQIFCKTWPDRDFLPRSIRSEENQEDAEESSA